MNGLFIVLLVLLAIIYITYNNMFDTVIVNYIYVVGVYKDSVYDKHFTFILIKLCKMIGINLIFKEYDSYLEIVQSCNNHEIDFAIIPEDYLVDSYLSLHSLGGSEALTNNRFMVGLYFKYIYCCSNRFVIDKTQQTFMADISHLAEFKTINKRHFIMGTEETTSMSFNLMMIIFRMYGMNLVNVNDIDNIDNDNTIRYQTLKKETLIKKYIDGEIDGIFIVDIQNTSFFKPLANYPDLLFLNLNLENTGIFDELLDYIYKKNRYKSQSLLSEQSNSISNNNSIVTRSYRNIMISNDKIDSDIVYKITNVILRNNNMILNKLVKNKTDTNEHNFFSPIDIIHLNKNIPYHNGSKKLYEEMKFIYYKKDDVEQARKKCVNNSV